jgi:hypothetical protein
MDPLGIVGLIIMLFVVDTILAIVFCGLFKLNKQKFTDSF